MNGVRQATRHDVPQMVALIEAKRRQYQIYNPEFWSKAANSAELSVPYFTKMVTEPSWCVLCAMDGPEMLGFISAREVPVPPVYDAVRACLVDDFTVRDGDEWQRAGRMLLDRFKDEARARDWRQVVVICGNLDEAKAAMLRDAGLILNTNWWTVRLPATSDRVP